MNVFTQFKRPEVVPSWPGKVIERYAIDRYLSSINQDLSGHRVTAYVEWVDVVEYMNAFGHMRGWRWYMGDTIRRTFDPNPYRYYGTIYIGVEHNPVHTEFVIKFFARDATPTELLLMSDDGDAI